MDSSIKQTWVLAWLMARWILVGHVEYGIVREIKSIKSEKFLVVGKYQKPGSNYVQL